MQNPFNSNPLTRNRTFPTIQFAQSDEERKNLHVPIASSYEDALKAYNDLHVPQQQLPVDPLAGFELERDKSLAPDEWNKLRYIGDPSSPYGEWGRPENIKSPEDTELDKRSQEYAKLSKDVNAQLSADAENNELQRRLLVDLESGRITNKTRLIDESKNKPQQ